MTYRFRTPLPPPSRRSAAHPTNSGSVGFRSRDASSQYVPVTVFGYTIGGPGDEYDAQQVLEAIGLSYLADRWSLTLDGRSEPISVQIVEASPQRVLVKNVDFGYEGDIGAIFRLDVPISDNLRRQ